MKFPRTLIIFLAFSIIVGCGGGGTTTSKSSDTGVTVTPLATLSVLNSTPSNGDGLITVTAVTSDVNPSGGDQVIHITGTSGDQGAIKHQIDIHYTIYFVVADMRGQITQITHVWGTTLENSIDGGISICNNTCNATQITPSLNTLVFVNQVLGATTNSSTLAGTVVYPNFSSSSSSSTSSSTTSN